MEIHTHLSLPDLILSLKLSYFAKFLRHPCSEGGGMENWQNGTGIGRRIRMGIIVCGANSIFSVKIQTSEEFVTEFI